MATTENNNGFTKNYIGKGKEVNGLDIVRVTIEMEKAETLIYEKEGKKYLTFEVARMKEADKFEKTHTVYVSTKNQ
jgi:hypothetical protein